MNWIEANQCYLAAEFTRLKVKLGIYSETGDPQSTVAPLSSPAAIDRLAEAFGLSAFERDLLLLCAGVEMDAAIAQRCAQLQGGAQRGHATYALALSVLDKGHWSALAPMSPLRRWRILEVDDSAGLTSGRLRLDERILHYLAGVNYLDSRLRSLLSSMELEKEISAAHRQASQSLQATLKALPWPARLVALTGDDSAGQRDIAAQVSSALAVQLYKLHAERLPQNLFEVEALATLWQREAMLLQGALLVECTERELPKQLQDFIEQTAGLLFITSREPISIGRPATTVTVNKPDAIEQLALWQQALGSDAQWFDGALEGVAAQFRLSASSIAATGSALREALGNGEAPNALLWQACRSASRSKLDELAQRIDVRASWKTLVLPPAQQATLQLVLAHVRHRLEVYEKWGFAERGTQGLGITVLFAGESGTGKTLAAEVLANDLHLDLYRIDLSSVVSKYIGDTEKNLRRVFDAAEESGVILLFDEADALFGRRSEVKDSHDRYANIEVSYLLQRMEAYRGLAILTTNMKASLDTAFRRRLRFVVQFPFPDVAQREAIWRGIFPATTPTERLDYSKLAKLHATGGNIRNIALNAAFLAAAAQEPVRMNHLLQAAYAEGAKRDRPPSDAETRGWV